MTKIQVWTDRPELLGIPECVPTEASKEIPTWFRSMPPKVAQTTSLLDHIFTPATAKQCPALPEFFSQGVVIRTWCDIYLATENGMARSVVPEGSGYRVQTHPPEQFLSHTPSLLGSEVTAVFKFLSPWYIKTAPGYSVYQLPLFYHFDKNFTVLPGVIRTDAHHEIHQQVMFHSKDREVLIPRGTPLAAYIPYKRDGMKLEITAETPELKAAREHASSRISGVFSGGYRALARGLCPAHIFSKESK